MTRLQRYAKNISAGAGILMNCLLLYAIRRFTRKSLGSYKQLLSIFAAYDVFLTVMHAIVKPVRILFYFEDVWLHSMAQLHATIVVECTASRSERYDCNKFIFRRSSLLAPHSASFANLTTEFVVWFSVFFSNFIYA